jgi:cytoplasmic polyadenylation element-binding protein
VFLGGLPWDVNQQYLVQLLQKYGSVKLEIPGKDQKHPRVSNIGKGQERSTPGYVYIIFEHESAVQRMLSDCRKEIKNGGEHYFYTIFIPPVNNGNNNNNANYYFNNNLNNKRGKAKEVEVIPWNQEDTSYVPQNKTSMLPAKIDAKTTIFVGALHGMLNAHGLAKVMNEVFGEVIHAGLDTDKYKYPIGK